MTTDGGGNIYSSKICAVERICDVIVHVGSDNPAELHCIINQPTLLSNSFNEDRRFRDIVILTVDRI